MSDWSFTTTAAPGSSEAGVIAGATIACAIGVCVLLFCISRLRKDRQKDPYRPPGSWFGSCFHFYWKNNLLLFVKVTLAIFILPCAIHLAHCSWTPISATCGWSLAAPSASPYNNNNDGGSSSNGGTPPTWAPWTPAPPPTTTAPPTQNQYLDWCCESLNAYVDPTTYTSGSGSSGSGSGNTQCSYISFRPCADATCNTTVETALCNSVNWQGDGICLIYRKMCNSPYRTTSTTLPTTSTATPPPTLPTSTVPPPPPPPASPTMPPIILEVLHSGHTMGGASLCLIFEVLFSIVLTLCSTSWHTPWDAVPAGAPDPTIVDHTPSQSYLEERKAHRFARWGTIGLFTYAVTVGLFARCALSWLAHQYLRYGIPVLDTVGANELGMVVVCAWLHLGLIIVQCVRRTYFEQQHQLDDHAAFVCGACGGSGGAANDRCHECYGRGLTMELQGSYWAAPPS